MTSCFFQNTNQNAPIISSDTDVILFPIIQVRFSQIKINIKTLIRTYFSPMNLMVVLHVTLGNFLVVFILHPPRSVKIRGVGCVSCSLQFSLIKLLLLISEKHHRHPILLRIIQNHVFKEGDSFSSISLLTSSLSPS